ncbi:MAG: hypothetical protein GY863_11080, partial [bacterium]|nr:hypothetical protein [bacterium]
LYNNCSAQDSSSELKGQYLGQDPPDLTQKIFAPGIVSKEGVLEFSCTFSQDGKEFYFARLVAEEKFTVFVTKESESGWSEPEIAPFSGDYFNNEPYITPDGNRIYWGSKRPLPNGKTDLAVWYMDREGEEWGEPKLFNFFAMYITSTKDRKLYFTDRGPGGAVLAWSSLDKGEYKEKHWLEKPFISDYYDAHPCIAPDESFLIFDSENRPESNECGLFISFRTDEGGWTVPKNMKSVIKKGSCAMLSPDGKYLFFSSQGDIHWISSKIIDTLRPEKKK